MATSVNFKQYQRQSRIMVVESLFNKGMKFTNAPLTEGYAKLLVNFDLKNQGTNLSPRGGIKEKVTALSGATFADTANYCIHHTNTTFVKSVDGSDATLHKYILLAKISNHPITGKPTYDFSDTQCVVLINGTYVRASGIFQLYSDTSVKLTNLHDYEIPSADLSRDCQQGLYVNIDANTYIPMCTGSGERYFVRMELQLTAAGGLTITFPRLEPKEIPASQVINTGYNMLKTNPYDFPNTSNVTGAVNLMGIIPKDSAGKIRLNADVGEALTFYLNYSYPTEHTTNSMKYYAQWEVKDTTNSSETQVMQPMRKSPTYTPGNDIKFTYNVAYKQFTVVVKLYNKAEVDAHTFVSEEDDTNKILPLGVITVSSYYLGTSGGTNTANLTPTAYNLATCKGLCAWQQRTVMWGIENAPTTLFVSQPNLPEYVPYPNNVEIFSENIVHCVSYLTNLLVFTTSKLYLVTVVTDANGTYYKTTCIQERLVMSEQDAATIQVVKNMVYFKSGNYFYMIVPNSSAGAGELQLAPVSRPIEFLLDNFKPSVDEILDDVHNISYTFDLAEGADDSYKIGFTDFYNYLDGSTMRNVYKCYIDIYRNNAFAERRHMDFVLNYDTILRSWTAYTYETNKRRMIPYESTITDNMVYAQLINQRLTLLQADNTSPKDEADLALGRVFHNHQYMDTGYRKHDDAIKKRFRELQFSINNTTQARLSFHTSFVVDDDTRRDLYQYNTVHITDPNDPNYGLIYVERELTSELTIADSTDHVDLEMPWILDFTKFPDITLARVRFKVSGKGYNGKMSLLSTNEEPYELLGTHWVYRTMYGR